MIYTSTITKKGQMTIPKPLRDVLGLEEGEKIFIEAEKDKKEIRIRPYPSIFELAGKFKPKKIENAIKIREKMTKIYGTR